MRYCLRSQKKRFGCFFAEGAWFMEKEKFKLRGYFTKGELALWCGSAALITVAFFAFGGEGVPSLIASLLGVTALIFCAKGNPAGQVMMLVFCVFYGAVSFTFAYYGEMITYLCMAAPMAAVSLVSWLRNPFKGAVAQVRVNRITLRETALMLLATAAVTWGFFFLLRALGTANLLPSTISVATSFAAAYLMFRRSEYFALAYALNDIVLVVLWVLACVEDSAYISMVICFAVFFVNDIYGYINWRRMRIQQERADNGGTIPTEEKQTPP